MTWTETHERIRIFHEVEAVAAADMSGAVPWREEWAPYFNGPAGLVAALRARWNHMCEAQLDIRTGEDDLNDAVARLRRSEAGILEILKNAAGEVIPSRVLTLAGPRSAPSPRTRSRRFQFHGGPVIPA